MVRVLGTLKVLLVVSGLLFLRYAEAFCPPGDICNIGGSAPSAPGTLTVPSTNTNGAYSLSWGAASGFTLAGQYKIFESVNGGAYSQIASISKNTTSYSLSGKPSGSYAYYIKACNIGNCSGNSNTDSIVVRHRPATPSAPSVPSTSTGSVVVSWSKPSGTVTYYDLQKRLNNGSWVSAQNGDTNTNHTETGLTNGSWDFRVRACYQYSWACSNFSADSANINTKLRPATPAAPTVSKTSATSVKLSWAAVANATYYSVQKRVNSGSWQNVTSNTPATSVNVSGLTEGTWQFRFRACNQESWACSSYGGLASFEVVPAQVATPDYAKKTSTVANAPVTLPSVPNSDVVGALQGEGGVSGGAATYSIPIALPPGRAGMQPEVSIGYSSRSGNGTMGVGFGLSAGSSITRCAKTYAQDGRPAGIEFGLNDALCLDGQRLIMVAGFEYGLSGTTYRTELDSFVKVYQTGRLDFNNSGQFVVYHKDGRKSYYGTSTQSRHFADGESKVLSWKLEKEQDTFGNTINYLYSNFAEGEHLLTKILYTGFNATAGDREVRFNYEPRPDRSTTYQAGGKLRSTQRLKWIETYYQTQRIRRYSINYHTSQSTDRSLVSSIQECAGNLSECLPATTFDWSESAPQYVFERVATTDQPTQYQWQKRQIDQHLPHADYNGDGVKDWPKYTTDAEGRITGTHAEKIANCYRPLNSFTVKCVQADFDNDGITDEFKKSNGKFAVRLSTLGYWQETAINWENQTLAYTPALGAQLLDISDYNGDGYADVVFMHPTWPNPELRVYFHSQNTATPYSRTLSQQLYQYQTKLANLRLKYHGGFAFADGDTVITTDIQLQGDMDGNGLPDVTVLFKDFDYPGLPYPTSILLNKGGNDRSIELTQRNFASSERLPQPSGKYVNSDIFADINGDGLPDWLAVQESTDEFRTGYLFAKLNTGTGFESNWRNLDIAVEMRGGLPQNPTQCPPGDICVSAFYSYPILSRFMFFDYNNDGVSDILRAKDLLASSCKYISGVNAGWRCDRELYGLYQPSLNSTPQELDSNNIDDTVYSYEAILLKENASGDLVKTTLPTNIIASSTQRATVDAYGNGLADIVTVFGCRWDNNPSSSTYNCQWNTEITDQNNRAIDPSLQQGIYMMRNKGAAKSGELYRPVDMLESVTNGLGVENKWDYRPLSTGDNPTTGSKANSESESFYQVDRQYANQFDNYFHFASSMYAVTKHSVTNGIGGFNDTVYRYSGAMFNNQGRGFQGFRSITVDSPSGVDEYQEVINTRSITEFHQVFPLAGKIQEIRKCLLTSYDPNCEQSPLSITQVNQYHQVNTANSKTWWTVPHISSQTNYALNLNDYELSNMQSIIEASDLSSRYGNVLKTTEITDTKFGVMKSVTENQFAAADESNWWINKLNNKTVTTYALTSTGSNSAYDSALDQTTKIKTNFTYTAQRAVDLVTTEALQGGGQTLTIDKDYSSYGLVSRIITRTSGETDRYTINRFSNDGYFIDETENQLGHIAQILTSPKHGQVVSKTDPNGNTSVFEHDNFGRLIEVSSPGTPTQYIRYFWCDSGLGGSYCDSNSVYQVATYQAGTPTVYGHRDSLERELLVETTSFSGGSLYVHATVNALGQKLFESVPSANRNSNLGTYYHSYDALGRLTHRTTATAGGPLEVEYQHSGHTTTILVNDKPPMSRTYDGVGRLVQTMQQNSNGVQSITRYGYDSHGNVTVMQDANGQRIRAKYNALNQKQWVSDPNMGLKTFTYNGFGEVATERDANGDTTRFKYDALGRVYQRLVNNLVQADFGFDSAFKLGTQQTCKGLPAFEKQRENGNEKRVGYDQYCRANQSQNIIDGETFTVTTHLDSFYGRVKGVTYPNGVTIEHQYNSYGYLTKTKNAASGYVYQNITAMDDWGQWSQAALANNQLAINRNYFEASGQMLGSELTTGSGNQVFQSVDYTYDDFGNIINTDVANFKGGRMVRSVERFDYDGLFRMTESRRSVDGVNLLAVNYSYDKVGNLTRKSDFSTNTVGSMSYGNGSRSVRNAGPNAVLSVALANGGGTRTYEYDNNGNLTIDRINGAILRNIEYNAFNKPVLISVSGGRKLNPFDTQTTQSSTTRFFYGADQMRFKQIKMTVSDSVTTLYVDKIYEEVRSNNRVEKKLFISDIAQQTEVTENGSTTFEIGFFHKDRLGSAIAISNETGSNIEGRSFDPFGKPRKDDLGDNPNNVLGSVLYKRGFTDHEHLDDSQLIHMNGRAYDYNLGRFLSVDPYVQFVGNSQGVNPYSYIMNNPLAGTDPSGYIIDTVWDAASIIYDLGKIGYGYASGDDELVEEGAIDLAADTAAILIPFVPAGSTKIGRMVAEGADQASDMRKAKKAEPSIESPSSKQANKSGDNGADSNIKNNDGDPSKISDNKEGPVKPGDTGTYGELKARKKEFGETEAMDMDHQPSFAAQKLAKEKEYGRPLSKKEANKLKDETPAVASPRKVHQQTSPTYGGRNSKERIEQDASDLEGARQRDRDAFDNAMKEREVEQ